MDSDIVMVRNSRAHKWTRYDPKTRTITFTNKVPGRPDKTVGPWSQEDFGRWLILSFLRRYLTMVSAYAVAVMAHQAGLLEAHLRKLVAS